MTSNIFKLNLNDFFKGLLMAIGTGAILVIYTAFQSDCGLLCIDWMMALNAGIAGGLVYLIKNFFTDVEGKLGGKL